MFKLIRDIGYDGDINRQERPMNPNQRMTKDTCGGGFCVWTSDLCLPLFSGFPKTQILPRDPCYRTKDRQVIRTAVRPSGGLRSGSRCCVFFWSLVTDHF